MTFKGQPESRMCFYRRLANSSSVFSSMNLRMIFEARFVVPVVEVPPLTRREERVSAPPDIYWERLHQGSPGFVSVSCLAVVMHTLAPFNADIEWAWFWSCDSPAS